MSETAAISNTPPDPMTALRSMLFDIFMATATAIMGIILIPALADRRAARAVTRIWARLMLGALGVLCGLRYRVIGEEFIPRGAAIVAGNHQSMWETIALIVLLDRPAMVLKKELLRVPVYGWWAHRTGVPIDRSAGARAIRKLRRETEIHIDRGDQIVVFPEGTRRPPGQIGDLQPGVAGMYLAANRPVIPFVHNSGEFWTSANGHKSPGEITIRFLPPIEPNLRRKDFMKALEAALHTPATGPG